MAVSSGFQSSPGHAALGNVLCTAPADRHGNQNGQCWEEHVDTIVILVIDNNHSQRPCYGPLKLKLRHSNIYYNVISLLLCFGHLRTTMDAVLATIVAGGRARIQLNIRLIKIY
jgi:hypothetical protein